MFGPLVQCTDLYPAHPGSEVDPSAMSWHCNVSADSASLSHVMSGLKDHVKSSDSLEKS